MEATQIVLASRPKGLPGDDQFRSETITLPVLKEDEVLVKASYFSVDPYMRGRMNESKSYVPPYKINEPIVGGGIGEIIESKSGKFKKGDIVQGLFPWATESVFNAGDLQKIDIKPGSCFLLSWHPGDAWVNSLFWIVAYWKTKSR